MKRIIVKCASLFLTIMITFSGMMVLQTEESFASSKTKTMDSYDCVKTGSLVYCTNSNKLFRVNLKTKKVSVVSSMEKTGGYQENLRVKGNWLYYTCQGNGVSTSKIRRINIKTGKKQTLAKNVNGPYVISGKRIYYSVTKFKNDGSSYDKNYVMKLNGKSKKATKYKIKMKHKKTNKKGYFIYDDENGEYMAHFYLAIPDLADIFLEYDWRAI